MGSRYQYDIIETNEVNRKHHIIGNVLSRWDNISNENHSTTTLLAEEQSNNTRTNDNQSENYRQNQQMDFKYINTGGKIGTRQNSVTANIIASQQKTKKNRRELINTITQTIMHKIHIATKLTMRFENLILVLILIYMVLIQVLTCRCIRRAIKPFEVNNLWFTTK